MNSSAYFQLTENKKDTHWNQRSPSHRQLRRNKDMEFLKMNFLGELFTRLKSPAPDVDGENNLISIQNPFHGIFRRLGCERLQTGN